MIEMSLLHLLAVSYLNGSSLIAQAYQCIRHTFVVVNGRRVHNPYTQLYVGDLLFVINYGRTRNALTDGVGAHLSDLPTYVGAKHSLHPNAFDFGARVDTPGYLEVDELTSSLSVIFEPSRWGL
jgi:ribosomal protein S4